MTGVDQTLQEIENWRTGKLRGSGAIARFAGVSESTIVRWTRMADCPITMVGGRYFVLRIDLMLWMRSKPASARIDLQDIA